MRRKPSVYLGVWSKAEEAVLLENYTSTREGFRICRNLLPGRTHRGIRCKAQSMGLAKRIGSSDPAYEGESYARFMRSQDKRFMDAFRLSGEALPT